jgi:hypothetical protein
VIIARDALQQVSDLYYGSGKIGVFTVSSHLPHHHDAKLQFFSPFPRAKALMPSFPRAPILSLCPSASTGEPLSCLSNHSPSRVAPPAIVSCFLPLRSVFCPCVMSHTLTSSPLLLMWRVSPPGLSEKIAKSLAQAPASLRVILTKYNMRACRSRGFFGGAHWK